MDRLFQLNAEEEHDKSAPENNTQHFKRNATAKRREKTQQRPQKYNHYNTYAAKVDFIIQCKVFFRKTRANRILVK